MDKSLIGIGSSFIGDQGNASSNLEPFWDNAGLPVTKETRSLLLKTKIDINFGRVKICVKP